MNTEPPSKLCVQDGEERPGMSDTANSPHAMHRPHGHAARLWNERCPTASNEVELRLSTRQTAAVGEFRGSMTLPPGRTFRTALRQKMEAHFFGGPQRTSTS